MATATTVDLPALGRGPYADGKREAVRAFYEEYFTLDGDANAKVATVLAGRAPQEFKDGFVETLEALAAAVREA